MKIPRSSYHWVLAALVAAVLLLTLSQAHGQGRWAALREGRLGAWSADRPSSAPAAASGLMATNSDTAVTKREVKREVKPGRDPGMAKDQQRASGKAKRIVRNTISQARHGVSPIDSSAKKQASPIAKTTRPSSERAA